MDRGIGGYLCRRDHWMEIIDNPANFMRNSADEFSLSRAVR